MADDIAISVKNVSKNFLLPHERQNSIKSSVVGIFRKRDKSVEVQHALKDISFDVKKGDFFGIVGRNGSGKSTLLKIIAGIYQPTGGKVAIDGKLVSFIELGVGFNSELTGRENIYLNGALLGFAKKEIDGMYDEIVKFAELEEFMDQKLKNYSSGMQVRLAFSVAIKAKGDILVLDEVLAVGDEAFQRKCAEFFREIKNDTSKTVVLVTHSMESVREYCNKALLINEGLVEINSEDVDTVADRYSRLFIEESQNSHNEDKRFGSGELSIEKVRQKTTKKRVFLDFDIVNNTDVAYNSVFVGLSIKHDGQVVIGNHMRYVDGYKKGLAISGKERKHITLEFENVLTKHDYTIDLSLKSGGNLVNFDTRKDVARITQPNPSGSKYYKALIPLSVHEGSVKK